MNPGMFILVFTLSFTSGYLLSHWEDRIRLPQVRSEAYWKGVKVGSEAPCVRVEEQGLFVGTLEGR